MCQFRPQIFNNCVGYEAVLESSLSPITRRVMGFINIDAAKADPRKAANPLHLFLIIISGRAMSVPISLLGESELCEYHYMPTCENEY